MKTLGLIHESRYILVFIWSLYDKRFPRYRHDVDFTFDDVMTSIFDVRLSKTIGFYSSLRYTCVSNLVMISQIFFELSSEKYLVQTDKQMKGRSENDTWRNRQFWRKTGSRTKSSHDSKCCPWVKVHFGFYLESLRPTVLEISTWRRFWRRDVESSILTEVIIGIHLGWPHVSPCMIRSSYVISFW